MSFTVGHIEEKLAAVTERAVHLGDDLRVLLLVEVSEAREKVDYEIKALIRERELSHVRPHVWGVAVFSPRYPQQRGREVESDRPPPFAECFGVTPGPAGKIEYGLNLTATDVRGDELDCPLRFRLVAVLVDPEVVFSERLLEPVRFLRL